MQSQPHAVSPPVIPLTALLRPGTALQLPQLFLCSMGTLVLTREVQGFLLSEPLLLSHCDEEFKEAALFTHLIQEHGGR